jgi:hypothetical protein
MFRRVILAVLLLALSLAADKKPKGAPLALLTDQTADIQNLAVSSAAQPCTNYAWAIAVETMLRIQNVPLDQHFWVQKATGGELCIDPTPDLDRLTRALDGIYTLDDGRKFKLETEVIPGAKAIPADAIGPLKKGIPVLVFWKSHAYVLRGATYDEYIYPNNQRMYQLKEFRMVDPLAKGKERSVSFVNGTDDPSEIAAFVTVTATPVTQLPWVRQPNWQNETKW